MSIQKLQAAGNVIASSATPITISPPRNIVTGNFLAVCVGTYFNSATVTVTDNLGNTYTQAGSYYDAGGNPRSSIWYAKNIIGGACTITVTQSTSTYLAAAVAEFSGVDTSSPLDGDSGGVTGSPIDGGLLSVSNPGSLVIACAVHTGNFNYDGPLGDFFYVGSGIFINAGCGIADAGFEVRMYGTTTCAVAAASFKAAGGGGGGGGGSTFMGRGILSGGRL